MVPGDDIENAMLVNQKPVFNQKLRPPLYRPSKRASERQSR
jgi:hypothetical protein